MLQCFPKGPARKQVTIKCCPLWIFLYDRNSQGFWRQCHHKIIFFHYSKKSNLYGSFPGELGNRKCSLTMRKQGICSVCLYHTLKVDHTVPVPLHHSLPSGATLPAPTSIYGGMHKVARFSPMVFKNKASMRGKARRFLSLNPI